MPAFFSVLRDVILLRRGPQDMPHAPRLLVAVCAASLALQLAIASVLGISGDAFGAGLIGLAFNLGVLYLLLGLRGVRSRFVQAALALTSCAMVFAILSVPIVLAAGGKPPTPETMTPAQALLGVLALPVVVWKLIVDAHILRHSLDVPFAAGLLIALFWIVAELTLGAALGGPAAATA
ncbi:MAG: hypothetical protein JSR27_10465 [Proteobacteria bacterium]|nr:hypothetical protein [Pseudomonadota bacterium]